MPCLPSRLPVVRQHLTAAVSLFAEAAQANGMPPARVQRVALLVDESLAELDAPAQPVDVRGLAPEDWHATR
ncbi:hypothetical protein [Myxococcus sp. NMCA1]|uniref:hypothetical protein n=1 Tax=Myxococcus sp. NMCA1 TaxID=2996785 RepID=UPI0022869BB1|nr:hypothetical protein [Myxococcus sp. NMCA1]WAM23788.1 hypothetical protein OZ403_24935 [Myxococcus sp. NMCA1]